MSSTTEQPGRKLPLAAQIGRVIAARYRLEKLLGEGCMGAVFQAWDGQRRQPCALKILHPDANYSEMAAVRFVDEAQMVARLCHPNIVEIWDYGRDADGSDYFVMELLHGESLYSLMQRHGPLPKDIALELIKQIGSALHAVHLSGIVHRDLKPQNILLIPISGTSDRWQAKVIDFGLAKLADHRQAPQRGSDGMLIGTASYLAPEAWRGVSSAVDARADQWALAVIAYRMLAGRLPYDADDNTVALGMLIHHEAHTPLRELVPDMPQHVQDAIDRALQKDKELRFPSVLHFVQALHQLPLGSTAPSVASDQLTARIVRRDEDDSVQPYVELICEPSGVPVSSSSAPVARHELVVAPPDGDIGGPQSHNDSLTDATIRLAGASVPTLVSLAAVPQPRRSRSAVLPYLLPALSFLGALLAWSGFWLGPAAPRADLPPSVRRIAPAIAGMAPGSTPAPPPANVESTTGGARAVPRVSGNDDPALRPCQVQPPWTHEVDPDFEPPPADLDPAAAAPPLAAPHRSGYHSRLHLR